MTLDDDTKTTSNQRGKKETRLYQNETFCASRYQDSGKTTAPWEKMFADQVSGTKSQ